MQRKIMSHYTNDTESNADFPIIILKLRSWITLRYPNVTSSALSSAISAVTVNSSHFDLSYSDRRIVLVMVDNLLQSRPNTSIIDLNYLNSSILLDANRSNYSNFATPIVITILVESIVNVTDLCTTDTAYRALSQLIRTSLMNTTYFRSLLSAQLKGSSSDSVFDTNQSYVSSVYTSLTHSHFVPSASKYCETSVFLKKPAPMPTQPPSDDAKSNKANNLNAFSQLASHPDTTLAFVLIAVLFILFTVLYIVMSNRDRALLVAAAVNSKDQRSSGNDSFFDSFFSVSPPVAVATSGGLGEGVVEAAPSSIYSLRMPDDNSSQPASSNTEPLQSFGAQLHSDERLEDDEGRNRLRHSLSTLHRQKLRDRLDLQDFSQIQPGATSPAPPLSREQREAREGFYRSFFRAEVEAELSERDE
jgi:hypothetical protein